jgi:uncharacterized protein
MRIMPLVFTAAVAMAALCAQAVIDCSKPANNPDRLVCSNDRLAAADERMARAFREALRRGVALEKLLATQRHWKANVRDVCNDVPCLLRAYEERTAELDSF